MVRVGTPPRRRRQLALVDLLEDKNIWEADYDPRAAVSLSNEETIAVMDPAKSDRKENFTLIDAKTGKHYP